MSSIGKQGVTSAGRRLGDLFNKTNPHLKARSSTTPSTRLRQVMDVEAMRTRFMRNKTLIDPRSFHLLADYEQLRDARIFAIYKPPFAPMLRADAGENVHGVSVESYLAAAMKSRDLRPLVDVLTSQGWAGCLEHPASSPSSDEGPSTGSSHAPPQLQLSVLNVLPPQFAGPVAVHACDPALYTGLDQCTLFIEVMVHGHVTELRADQGHASLGDDIFSSLGDTFEDSSIASGDRGVGNFLYKDRLADVWNPRSVPAAASAASFASAAAHLPSTNITPVQVPLEDLYNVPPSLRFPTLEEANARLVAAATPSTVRKGSQYYMSPSNYSDLAMRGLIPIPIVTSPPAAQLSVYKYGYYAMNPVTLLSLVIINPMTSMLLPGTRVSTEAPGPSSPPDQARHYDPFSSDMLSTRKDGVAVMNLTSLGRVVYNATRSYIVGDSAGWRDSYNPARHRLDNGKNTNAAAALSPAPGTAHSNGFMAAVRGDRDFPRVFVNVRRVRYQLYRRYKTSAGHLVGGGDGNNSYAMLHPSPSPAWSGEVLGREDIWGPPRRVEFSCDGSLAPLLAASPHEVKKQRISIMDGIWTPTLSTQGR